MDGHGRRAHLGVRCRRGRLEADSRKCSVLTPPPTSFPPCQVGKRMPPFRNAGGIHQDFWPHRSYPIAATGGEWCGQSKNHPPCSLVGHGLGHRLPDGRDPDCRCDSFGYFEFTNRRSGVQVPLGAIGFCSSAGTSSGLFEQARDNLELCNHKKFIAVEGNAIGNAAHS